MEPSEDVIDVSVHPFREEAIVEITGEDDRGEIVVTSYLFDVDASGDAAVARSRTRLGEPVESLVRRELADHGYTLDP